MAQSRRLLQITHLDIHTINDALRQIQEILDSLSGLTDATVQVAPHTHGASQTVSGGGGDTTIIEGGGAVDHDDLNNVTVDQHHDESHAHDGADGSGTVSYNDLDDLPADPDTTDNVSDQAQLVERITDQLIEGPGIQLTELADSSGDAVQLAVDSTVITTSNTDWVDLTDGGATTLHSHAGGGASFTDQELSEAQLSERLADQLFETGALELTERDESHTLQLRGLGPLTNGDADTPELIFADGEVILA